MRPDSMQDLSHDEVMDIAWANVPLELRQRMVDHINTLPTETLYYIRDHINGDHFGLGMSLRNYMRKAIKDAELPPFDEYYGEGTDVRNWDDYYMNALKTAVGLRDINS